MLFNFQDFIEDLRNKEDKKEIVEKYEKQFGPIQGDLKDQGFYTEYLSKFSTIEYAVPEETKDDFDWDLLLRLVIGSLSSDYELKFQKEDSDKRDLFIAVKSGDQSVVKTVSELRSFQIMRLYEIYVEEQMNLHILKNSEEKEKAAIDQEREVRLRKWKAVLDTIDKSKIEEEAKKEQEKKLGNLYDQL